MIPAFLDCSAPALGNLVSDLSLIRLEGDREPALLISVLLHGNETTGWQALQQLLRQYQGQRLPRTLIILFGNLTAARHGQRRLTTQPDFNRIWGADCPHREAQTARAILSSLEKYPLFAAIDIHNNTGANPYYSCLSQLSPQTQTLAQLFSPIALYYPRPTAVPLFITALNRFCPAVLLECGQPDRPEGTSKVLAYLQSLLHLDTLSPCPPQELAILETIATVKLPDHFTGTLQLPPHLDRYNFQPVPPHTLMAHSPEPFLVLDSYGNDRFDEFFCHLEGQIITRQAILPAMLTPCPQIIRQDCFCYLMQSLSNH